ncbi:MAG: hypothetical protein JWO06_1001, partial [Bacteroidota bacterium]|nr:hypothetical protein [Bacteroidota bacterium]
MPPLLVIIYYLMSRSSYQSPDWYQYILLFLLSSIGFGIMGYLINDWADIKENSLQQRPNFMGSIPAMWRYVLTLPAIAVAVVPWYFLLFDKIVIALLSIQILCYLVYSFYPFRIKERGMAGLLLDAIYAHVLPAVLVIYAFSQLGHVDLTMGFLGCGILLCYLAVVGVRNIIMHQQKDFEDDKNAGTKTFVVSSGLRKTNVL